MNLYNYVGMEQPEVKPVESALVDDRVQKWTPKKPSLCEAGSSHLYRWG